MTKETGYQKLKLPLSKSELKDLLCAIDGELEESFLIAESNLAQSKKHDKEKEVKFWKGELAALHRISRVMRA